MRPSTLLSSLREGAGLAAYTAFRRLPSGPGYHAHRARLIRGMIEDPRRLELLRGDAPLPAGYGVGVDERCIEYPWLLMQLQGSTGRLLDAGSILNNAMMVSHPTIARHDLHILTLAPETESYWDRGVSYLFADLRDNPVRDGFYDSIVCASTLEHVGCDNRDYAPEGEHGEQRPDDYRRAIAELARVLRPGGTLLVTVPYGRHANHGWFQVFDEPMIAQVVAAFGPAREHEVRYFGYTKAGWQVSTARDSADASYARWLAAGPARRFWPIRETDDAVGARAVACLRLVKG